MQCSLKMFMITDSVVFHLDCLPIPSVFMLPNDRVIPFRKSTVIAKSLRIKKLDSDQDWVNHNSQQVNRVVAKFARSGSSIPFIRTKSSTPSMQKQITKKCDA